MDITNYLGENFQSTDNVTRDMFGEESIHMESKSSLLIELLAGKSRLRKFLNSGHQKKGFWRLPLSEAIIYEQELYGQKYTAEFDEFIIHTGKSLEKDDFNQTGRVRLAIEKPWCNHFRNSPTFCEGKYNCTDGCISLPFKTGKCYENNQPILHTKGLQIRSVVECAVEELQKKSLFELCKSLTRYNTPEKVCRFTNNEALGFAPVKVNSDIFWQNIFNNQNLTKCPKLEAYLKANPQTPEEDSLQRILQEFVFDRGRDIDLSPAHEKKYSGWLQQVISFGNESDEVTMKALKLYCRKTQSKMLIAASSWRGDYLDDEIHCMPFVDKQILLHQKEIQQSESPIIILTDSPEIVAINQPQAPDNVIWTSFLCNAGQYQQVDFGLLQDAEEIYLLVTNHSGVSLAEKYKELRPLAEHLREQYGLSLKFIQLEVNYHKNNRFFFEDVSDIIKHQLEFPPRIIPNSIKLMDSFEEFEEMHNSAVQSLITIPFWQAPGAETEGEDDKTKKKSIRFLMRPILAKKKLTIGHAPSETGKSSLFLALSAAVVSGKSPIKGKSWNVFTSSKFKYNKVVYLDFESGDDLIDIRRNTIVKPYFPADPIERKKCMENLIIRDFKGDNTNYSDPANHQKIIDTVVEATDEGEKGHPADMCVIDTYGNLIKAEHSHTWHNIEPLINKLLAMNMAVVIVGHSHADGKKMEGFVKKLHSCEVEIKLFRKDASTGTLNEPMLVETGKNRLAETKIEKQPFLIRLKNGFELYDPAPSDLDDSDPNKLDFSKTENIEYGLTVEAYKGTKRYSMSEIAKMMGNGKSQLYERYNKFKDDLPKDKDYCARAMTVRDEYMEKKK